MPRRQHLHCSRLQAAERPPPEGGSGSDLSMQELAEQLMRDPDTAARLQRVNDAAQRVAELQAESERLALAMAAAAAEQAEGSELRERGATAAASALMAEAEVAAAQKLLQAAELQAQAADITKLQWAADREQVRGGRQRQAGTGKGNRRNSLFLHSC
jgi:hypothetical protein